MIKTKLFVDQQKKPPKGWIWVKNYDDFKLLLDTVGVKNIEAISFSYDLGGESILDLNGEDCSTYLISEAKGSKLPQCLIHDKSAESRNIKQIIDHYNDSYKYENECLLVTE